MQGQLLQKTEKLWGCFVCVSVDGGLDEPTHPYVRANLLNSWHPGSSLYSHGSHPHPASPFAKLPLVVQKYWPQLRLFLLRSHPSIHQ